MDLKGITWVGDVYQKFEAMCLEVEETMYEDTVKYVENQVQTVGASMKKFYAEVMQDLVQPASEDSAKAAAIDRSVELHTDLGVYSNPKMTVKDNRLEFRDKEQLRESWKTGSAKSSDLSSAFLCHVDNLFPLAQGNSARGALEKYTKGSLSKKSSLGISKIRERESMRQHQVPLLASPLTRTQEVPFDQQARLATSGSGCIEESKTDIAEPKVSMSARSTADMVSNRAMPLESGNPCSNNRLAESNHSYVSEDASSAKASELSGKFAYTEDYISSSERPSDWDIDTIIDNCCTDEEPETDRQTVDQQMVSDQQQADQALLEESCIVVSEDEFDFVSRSEGKSSSYKKILKEVFSPRRRSSRKQRLAELKTVNTQSGQEQCERSSSSALTGAGVAKLEYCDPEWELV